MSTHEHAMEEVRSAMQRTLPQMAFCHWFKTGVDHCAGLLLKRVGLLKKDVPCAAVPIVVADAVRDPSHKTRVNTRPSPLVVLRNHTDESKREIVTVHELLLSPTVEARHAALAHFARHTETPDSYLSPHSENALQEYSDDIRSEKDERWIRAAMRLVDILTEDFKLNVAAMKLGVDTGVEEIFREHWPRVIRPSLPSLLSIREDGYQLLRSREKFESTVESIVQESDSFAQSLDRFDMEAGHLPLKSELSIAIVAQRWLELHGEHEYWDALQEWGNTPQRKLQACSIAVLNPSIIPRDKAMVFWDSIEELLTADLADGTQDVIGAALRNERILASHYFRYLETTSLGMDADRLATVSWWAARAANNIIIDYSLRDGAPIDIIDEIHRTVVEPMINRSEVSWELGYARSGETNIRYATLYAPTRLNDLSASIAERIEELPTNTMKPQHVDAITATFTGSLLRCFPIVTTRIKDDCRWSCDSFEFDGFIAWSRVIENEQKRGDYETVLQMAKKVRIAEERQEALKTIYDANEATQLLLSQVFHVLACTDPRARDVLWSLLTDEKWRQGCFKMLSLHNLRRLFAGIMELAQSITNEQREELTHMLAQATEQNLLDEDRKSLLFMYTIQASVNFGMVSAIRRLTDGPCCHDLCDEVRYWQGQLESILSIVPPLTAGRLRDTLSSMTTV